MEALSERNAYLEVCASLLEDTAVGSEPEGASLQILDAPFQPALPPAGLQFPAAPDKVVGGSQALGEDHLITWVFKEQVLCVTDLSTTLPMPPTSLRIRLPEAPLSRDAVRLFPAAREPGREGSKFYLVIVTRALQLYRLTLSLPARTLTEQDVTDPNSLYGVPYTSVLSGRVEAWAQVRVEQLPAGATVLTCASWSEHDTLVVGFNSGRIQKMNVFWDLNGVSVRLELPEPSKIDAGGGLGYVRNFVPFVAQRPAPEQCQQALSAQEYSFEGQSILLTLHADSKVRTWNSTRPIQTMQLPGARTRIGPGDTATWHKVALLPSYAQGVGRVQDGWYMVALMASANFSQLWLSHRMYEHSELWLPAPVAWHPPYNCLDLIRDVSLTSCMPSAPVSSTASPSRRGAARGEPMVLWMVKALGVEGIEVTKDHVNIDEKQAQLRRVWRPPSVLGGSAAGLLPRNPQRLSEALRHMEEAAQGGSWWDERMAEHEGVFARMLVQRQDGLGGYSRALLERVVDRWQQVGAPAADPAPADPEARALWLAKLVRAAVQRDYAPEPYDPSLHGREMLERLVLQWWSLVGLVERGHEQDSTPLALVVPPPPANAQQPQPSLIVRADRVCALVSARPLLLMSQGQAPAAGSAMPSPSKLRWFGWGDRMEDNEEGASHKVSIQRTEAAVASVKSWMNRECPDLMPELLRCINDGLHYQGGRLPSHARIKRIVEHFLSTAQELPPELTLSMGNVETYLKHLELLPTLSHQPPAGEAGLMTPLSAVLCARSMVPLLHGHLLPRVLVLLVALLLLEDEGMMPLRATAANQVEEDAKLRSCVVWSSILLHRVVVLCHLSTHPMLQNQKTHSSLTAQSAMLAPSAAVPPPPFSHPLLSVFLLHLQAALEPQPTCPPHIKKLTLPCSPLPPRDDQTPTASEAPVRSALVLLYKVLIYRPLLLLRFLEGEQQYRHLFVLVQTLMGAELDGVENLTPAEKRDLKRILARCYINEARRVVDEDPQGAEGLFDLAEKTLLAYDDCTLALEEGDEERRRGAGEMDFQDDESDMQVDSGVEEHKGSAGDTRRGKVTRAGRRAQHFLKAVAMLQPSVGLCGCPPRRLIRLAAAGLRGLPSGRAAYGEAGDPHALSQAELLWGIIFTAAMEENRFDEALAAIRAEYDLWQDVDPDKADAARSTKLSLLVVELCERGRFDKVCGLPWSKGEGRDEMDVVEGVLRAYARFVFIEGESSYESAIVTAGMQQKQYSRGEWDAINHKQRRRSRGSDGGRRLQEDRMDDGSADRTEGAPVDYYQALFAFLVRVRNYRGAATEMYRLCKRLDAGTAFEDDLLRLNKKIEALAQVCNCLELLPADQQLLLWATEELLPTEDAIGGTGVGGSSSVTQKRVKVVTIGDVRHELAFAIASREYLQKAGAAAQPLRPLNLTPPSVKVPGGGNKRPGGPLSVSKQVSNAAELLTKVGLHESAASLLSAFDMPLDLVIRSLAEAVVGLGSESGSLAPTPFVLEALPVHAHSFTFAAGHDPSVPGPHLQARQAEALLRDILEREGRGSYYVEAARVMVIRDSYFLPDWLLDAFTTPGGVSANQPPDAGAFLQVHAKKAWYLVRGARAAVSARPSGSRTDSDLTDMEQVLVPSGHSRVEAMHLLVRALRASVTLVDKASHAVAGALSAGGMMQHDGARGAKQLWVPLPHMDVLLQLASQIAPRGVKWGRPDEREGAAALQGASEALMDSLKGYYKDVAIAEAALPDIQ